jgi:hypothetical protein
MPKSNNDKFSEVFRVSGSNSAIIGNLDKGDYTMVSFQITSSSSNFSGSGSTGQRRQLSQQDFEKIVRDNLSNQIMRQNNTTRQNFSQDNNNLLVRIDYTDTTGERRSVEKMVAIQFRTSTTGVYGTQTAASPGFVGSTTFWVLIGVVVVILFCVFGTKAKREKIFGKKK